MIKKIMFFVFFILSINSFSLAETCLTTETLTSNVGNTFSVSSTNYYDNSCQPWKAFDNINNLNNMWLSSAVTKGNSTNFKIMFTDIKNLSKITIACRSDVQSGSDQNPTSIIVYGYNDDMETVQLASASGWSWSLGEIKTIYLPANSNYKNISFILSNTKSNYIGFTEVEVYGDTYNTPTPTPTPTPIITPTPTPIITPTPTPIITPTPIPIPEDTSEKITDIVVINVVNNVFTMLLIIVSAYPVVFIIRRIIVFIVKSLFKRM